MKEIINNINLNDKVFITIYDCGSGYATILEKNKDSITIKIEENWSCCYENQSLIKDIITVCTDFIAEITVC